MSAYTNRENIERAMSLGADQVVAKPIKTAAMTKAINEVINSGRQKYESMTGLLETVNKKTIPMMIWSLWIAQLLFRRSPNPFGVC